MVQLLLMKWLKMYYLLEKQGRILWPGFLHYLPLSRGAEVTDSKRAKNNDTLKKQKIYMFNTSNKRKKHQTIPEDKEKEKLDLKHVLQRPVLSKPWGICSKVDQRRSSICSCLETIYSSYLLPMHKNSTICFMLYSWCSVCGEDDTYHQLNTYNNLRMGKTII